jgi:hypothetical protein
MQHRSQYTTSEIEERLTSLVHKGQIFLPTNRALFIARKGDEFILKGLLCITRVKISKAVDVTNLELRSRFNWPVYFILGFLAIFFSAFLFSDKVTLNGNSDPTFLEKLGFVATGVALFSVPIFIAVKLKSNFEKEIQRKIIT